MSAPHFEPQPQMIPEVQPEPATLTPGIHRGQLPLESRFQKYALPEELDARLRRLEGRGTLHGPEEWQTMHREAIEALQIRIADGRFDESWLLGNVHDKARYAIIHVLAEMGNMYWALPQGQIIKIEEGPYPLLRQLVDETEFVKHEKTSRGKLSVLATFIPRRPRAASSDQAFDVAHYNLLNNRTLRREILSFLQSDDAGQYLSYLHERYGGARGDMKARVEAARQRLGHGEAAVAMDPAEVAKVEEQESIVQHNEAAAEQEQSRPISKTEQERAREVAEKILALKEGRLTPELAQELLSLPSLIQEAIVNKLMKALKKQWRLNTIVVSTLGASAVSGLGFIIRGLMIDGASGVGFVMGGAFIITLLPIIRASMRKDMNPETQIIFKENAQNIQQHIDTIRNLQAENKAVKGPQ